MDQNIPGLNDLQDKLNIVIRNSKQIVYEYNLTTGKIEWIGAIKEVTGYEPEEFSGFGIEAWTQGIHPDDREKATKLLEEAEKIMTKYSAEYKFKKRMDFT